MGVRLRRIMSCPWPPPPGVDGGVALREPGVPPLPRVLLTLLLVPNSPPCVLVLEALSGPSSFSVPSPQGAVPTNAFRESSVEGLLKSVYVRDGTEERV